ncbi:alpha/beta hydrolase [Marinagarivorans algicola]|uniref:alpha/beta hydrolase n=1 Tax=Marinagarivorans algicola TaxID=1513270 RepID=UPI000B25360A|nr:alpha/beta hydrolase [Marinagarivorans algicola]
MIQSDNLKTMPRHCTECTFKVANLTFAAKRWQPQQATATDSAPKILALHGWLDNCASFDFIAPQLNADVVCVDLAGHGRSSPRNHLGAYNIWLDVPELLEIADQLGWGEFSILGHSRGAAVGFILAGTVPQRVQQIVCLDGIFPLINTGQSAPEQLLSSINAVKKQRARAPSIYAHFEQAVKARQQSAFPVTYEAAVAFAQWGVEPNEGGFSWRYDPKLHAPSELKLTRGQVEAFASNITAPMHVLLANDGLITAHEESMALLSQFNTWTVKYFAGGHHFHMAQASESIVNYINELY